MSKLNLFAQQNVEQSNPFQVFDFKDKHIRVAYDNDNALLFCAKDVCEALDITWNGSTLKGLPSEFKRMLNFSIGHKNQTEQTTFLTREGVIFFVARSNKPEAKDFTIWMIKKTSELMTNGKVELKPQERSKNIVSEETEARIYLDRENFELFVKGVGLLREKLDDICSEHNITTIAHRTYLNHKAIIELDCSQGDRCVFQRMDNLIGSIFKICDDCKLELSGIAKRLGR